MPTVVSCDLHGEVLEMGKILTLSSSHTGPSASRTFRSHILLMASVGNPEPVKGIRQRGHSPRNIPELARPLQMHCDLTPGVGPVTSKLSGLVDSGPGFPQRAAVQSCLSSGRNWRSFAFTWQRRLKSQTKCCVCIYNNSDFNHCKDIHCICIYAHIFKVQIYGF